MAPNTAGLGDDSRGHDYFLPLARRKHTRKTEGALRRAGRFPALDRRHPGDDTRRRLHREHVAQWSALRVGRVSPWPAPDAIVSRKTVKKRRPPRRSDKNIERVPICALIRES